jgi:phage gp36-like protein
MAYVARADVEGKIPPQYLIEALDDDNDGAEDPGLFDQLVATASRDVDSFLAGLFSTPFPDPVPAQVYAATLAFVCESIYARRITPEQRNPFGGQANDWRKRLQLIGDRKLPFDAGDEGAPVATAQSGSQSIVPGRLNTF